MKFDDASKEEKLRMVAQRIADNIPALRIALTEGRTNERLYSMSEWEAHQDFALKSFFIDDDLDQAKQHFYTCGRLDEFLINKYDEKILDYGINHLSYALLSDNEPLIRRYAALKHSTYNKAIDSGTAAPMYVLQCLINDDWAEYERVMPIVKEKSVRKFKIELDAAYYEALAERNQLKIEELLAEFVSPKIHKKRNSAHELINEFISHPALGYAKLAWLKGMEVNINSPLIPPALLPVRPNREYKDVYNFLGSQ